MILLADVNHSESREDVISNWNLAHSLIEDVVSGSRIAETSCPLALAVAQLPLCLCRGRALCGSCLSLLCYLLNLLFCEHARGHHVVLESFAINVFVVVVF